MRKSLAIKHETLALLHWIIDVEVLHAQDVLVNIERVEVPD